MRFWVAGTLAFLLVLELGLHMIGFLGHLYQRGLNHTDDEKVALRVLTLGESTTADLSEIEKRVWPRFLEIQLKEQGLELQLTNLAQVGTNTNAIVESLPQVIEQYKPNIVITMMGINDYPLFGLRKNYLIPSRPHWSHRVKLFKLITSLRDYYLYDPSLQEETNPYRHVAHAEQFAESLKRGEPQPLEIELELTELNNFERAHYYAQVAYYLTPKLDAPINEFSLAHEYLKRSLKISFLLEHYVSEFLFLSMHTGQTEDCRWVFDEYVSKEVKISAFILGRLAECLGPESEALRHYFDQSIEYQLFEPGSTNVTKENYHLLVDFLMRENVCLIAMQYPLLSRDLLTEYFAPEVLSNLQDKKLWIIDNVSNFRQALLEHPYDELFTDRFAGEFGHTTVLGSQMIADNVAEVLGEIIATGQCK